ncbi:LysM peptidoglycan-binding domain-containing protein [Paenibacillus tritici]|uniref:LysM peptidoglycan-binding domain-containing protein n=1 Tax=Paenibacillus tritici TaxID=1873425 RepID=A0ABX2DP37_9BACL|nr:LysM peptidoglycan-binding domain-containing protein [Paenibacillus tritici]
MKIHIVKQGDSLFALSQKYGVPLQKIIEANPQITNPDVLAVGDKVKIPAAPVPIPVPDNNDIYYKHTVKQGDTLWKLSKAWGVTLKDMIDANPQLKNPNALMTGEVVNIPKKVSVSPIQAQSTAPAKANTAPIQAQSAAPAVVDKTAIGGKTYTGVIEKTAPAPAPAPVAEAVPIPLAVPAPNPAPNKAPEVMPVQEAVPEKQSLYVQISVPAQEAPAYEKKSKEAHKTEVQPASWGEGKADSMEKTGGYPGLNENPYFMNHAPVYPMYEPMGMMNMNNAPSYAQPAAFMPECPPNYADPANAYPAAQYPGAWYPNAAPDYNQDYNNVNMSAVSPVSDNASFAPQYHNQQVNLPWPSCGCGGMSIQPYPYEQPMYNGYPVYGMPQMGMASPYSAGMNSMPNAVSPMYEQPMVSNIPPYPAYPGMENFAHNRVPEIQIPEPAVEEPEEVTDKAHGDAAPIKDTKTGTSKAATKLKASGQTTATKEKAPAKPRPNSSGRSNTSTVKKNSGPWVPN